MRKSVSNPSLSLCTPASLPPPPRFGLQCKRSASNSSLNAMNFLDAPPMPEEIATEVIAEAVASATLPNLGMCTQLYGFPNEVLQKSHNASSARVLVEYMSCLLEPDEGVADKTEKLEYHGENFEVTQRIARWFRVERRRKRRWSFSL